MGPSSKTPAQAMNQMSPSPFFDRLPRELRDEIYTYAYGLQSKPIWVATREWEERGRLKRVVTSYGNMRLRPLPECPLNRLAVSKQFYEEAAPTFLRAATLRIEDVDSFDHFVGHMPVSLLPFITTVHINSLGFGKGFAPLKKLSACSGIRELRLAIEDVGAIWYSWYTWSNNTAYFERLRSIKYLLAAESLRSVTLVAGRRVLVLDGAGNLQKNIAALNKVVALKLQARSSPDYGEQPESTAWHTDSSSLRRSKRVKLSEGTQGCETPGASGVAELTYSFT